MKVKILCNKCNFTDEVELSIYQKLLRTICKKCNKGKIYYGNYSNGMSMQRVWDEDGEYINDIKKSLKNNEIEPQDFIIIGELERIDHRTRLGGHKKEYYERALEIKKLLDILYNL